MHARRASRRVSAEAAGKDLRTTGLPTSHSLSSHFPQPQLLPPFLATLSDHYTCALHMLTPQLYMSLSLSSLHLYVALPSASPSALYGGPFITRISLSARRLFAVYSQYVIHSMRALCEPYASLTRAFRFAVRCDAVSNGSLECDRQLHLLHGPWPRSSAN